MGALPLACSNASQGGGQSGDPTDQNTTTGTTGNGVEPGNVPTTPPATSPNGTSPPAGTIPLPVTPLQPAPTQTLKNGNDTAIVPTAAIPLANIGFDGAPVADNKAIALTFDDGPDGATGYTDQVLDTLKKENIKATFFICAGLFTNLETDPIAQKQLRRIFDEGHSVGSHTYKHLDLATLTNDQVDAAFAQNQNAYKAVMGPNAPVISLVRAPFGSPFQLDPTTTKRVAPVVAKYGIQIGWGMDPKDWACDKDGQCVINAVQQLLNNKQWGIILLHSVHKGTADVLPTLISMMRQGGYHFVDVEDVVRAQYGVNSASLYKANLAAAAAAGAKP